jgi:hypothetical protein
MELHELQERWTQRLDVAETHVANEPMAALDATRAVALEIEGFLDAAPGAQDELALLLTRARSALARSHEASARWLAASAERGRRHQKRELDLVALPMHAMRNPWPPRVSG